jgi:hypothetical protein
MRKNITNSRLIPTWREILSTHLGFLRCRRRKAFFALLPSS